MNPHRTPQSSHSRALLARGSAIFIALLAGFTTGCFSGSLESDDFNTCGLQTTRWTLHDRLGGSTAVVTGEGTGDAKLVLSVPAGSAHVAWGPNNNAARLLQELDLFEGSALQVEAKFDSVLSVDSQTQGLIFESGTDRWLRFDVTYDGSDIRIFAGSSDAGVETTHFDSVVPAATFPIYLRLGRVAGDWTAQYSPDGTNFTTAGTFSDDIEPSLGGVFAGNDGTNPAHTAEIDYYFNKAFPIPNEDQGVIPTDFVLTANSASTLLGNVSVSPVQATYACKEIVTVTPVPEPGSVFDFWTGDAEGSSDPLVLEMRSDVDVTAHFVPPPPVISDVFVHATDSVARVSWTTDVDATTEVSYGETTNYEIGTELDATPQTNHEVLITGLTPDTSYNAEAASSLANGVISMTGNLPFTTTPPPPNGLRSDDFNNCSIDGQYWNFIDPRGDSSVQMVGGGTGDAALQISVPSGISHDPFDSSGNNVARLMQATDDGDFDIRAKFDSLVTQRFQIQGLMVETDLGDLVRVDVSHDGTDTNLFVGTRTGGASGTEYFDVVTSAVPLYLRLVRVLDDWTASYSTDGSSWIEVVTFNYAMAAASVGVFAGNDGNDPAHTAVIDYFESSSDPIANEDVGGIPNDNVLIVTSQGAGTVATDPDQLTYACGDIVSVSATPTIGWVFSGWDGDATGNQSPVDVTMLEHRSVNATFQQITTPPTISNVQVAVTESTATITWTTDQPTRSTIHYGLTTEYANTPVDDGLELKTDHSITLTGLDIGTLYHFEITSTNEVFFASMSGDMTFMTDTPLPSTGIESDDFNVCAIDPGRWDFIDPRANSSVTLVGGGTGDASVQITVPAGISHDPFDASGNNAARLMQGAVDGDLEVRAKFDSEVTEQVQEQGLMIETATGDLLRVDVSSNGLNTQLFVGTRAAGITNAEYLQPIPASLPLYLRVIRIGDNWTASYSPDSLVWTDVVTFSYPMAVATVGVFAGNDGADPAHTAIIDYFETSASPILDEDGASLPADNTLTTNVAGSGTVITTPDQPLYVCGASVEVEADPDPLNYFTGWSGDLTGTTNPETIVMNVDRSITASFSPISGPPTLSDIVVSSVSESTAVITWTTDHPSTTVLDYGETTAYEMGRIEDLNHVTQHSVLLTGLAPFTPYHFRVSSENELLILTTSGDNLFITQPVGGPGGPLINAWYGDVQQFGTIGNPQPDVNIVGNVIDADGVASLSYTLNSGASISLNIGPDTQRLGDPGDFNIDIPGSLLVSGPNTVTITAVDNVSETTNKTVIVNYQSGNVWPTTYSVDWNTVTDISDVGQVVDGLWEVSDGALRTIQVDYDRLVAIGDIGWQDYEVEAPITIHSFSPKGFNPGSNRPGVGLVLRWGEHVPPGQPKRGFDLGAIGFYRIGQTGVNKLEMWTHDSPTSPSQLRDLTLGTTYIFKMQVETTATAHTYRFKVYEQGTPEPSGWDLIEDQDLATARADGSALLIAHHVDASFGTVTVTPLP